MMNTFDQALEQNKRLVENNFQLNSQNSALQAELRQYREKMNNSTHVETSVLAQVNELSQQLATANAQLKDKEDICKNQFAKLSLIEKKFLEADCQVKNLQTQLAAANETAKSNSTVTGQVQIAAKDKELMVITREIQNMKKLLDRTIQENEKLNKERIELMKGHGNVIDPRLQELKTDNEKLVELYTTSEQKVQHLERMNQSLEMELKSKQNQNQGNGMVVPPGFPQQIDPMMMVQFMQAFQLMQTQNMGNGTQGLNQ